MAQKYMLNGHDVVECNDLMKWAMWFETADRIVRQTDCSDSVHVSTVFLGLDHQFGNGAPLFFETMIFGGPHDGYCDRYSTWDDAEAGHVKAVELASSLDAVDPIVSA